ncbi:MAG: hypothetical protein PHU49_07980 [Syntrophorhabdaceae bacterium]|nr:hypothetical protein [Syntrophorhabdaceae bacterium]MDD5243942.1 hypothetical protein [Syntrophorhabdaceae bacterium]
MKTKEKLAGVKKILNDDENTKYADQRIVHTFRKIIKMAKEEFPGMEREVIQSVVKIEL